MGGHTAVKESAAEDLAILKMGMNRQYRYDVCSPGLYKVRMYNTGLSSFINGWTRILRLGVKQSNLATLVTTFLFIMHLCLPVFSGIALLGGFAPTLPPLAIVSSFIINTIIIQIGARRILNENHWMNWLYPLALILFLFIMVKTILEKIQQKPIYWRSREIPN